MARKTQRPPSEDLPASIAPIEAIVQEAEKVKRMPDQVGVLQGRPMNGWIDESLTRPKPRSHCRGLIVEGENTVVFASSNVGTPSVAASISASKPCDIAPASQLTP